MNDKSEESATEDIKDYNCKHDDDEGSRLENEYCTDDYGMVQNGKQNILQSRRKKDEVNSGNSKEFESEDSEIRIVDMHGLRRETKKAKMDNDDSVELGSNDYNDDPTEEESDNGDRFDDDYAADEYNKSNNVGSKDYNESDNGGSKLSSWGHSAPKRKRGKTGKVGVQKTIADCKPFMVRRG